ncbi:MAG: PAS domain S-box protein, partial [Pseudomonas putida]
MDDNYRAAVDAAAIFSETDLRGNITYVNQQFCSISGYSREELLGANHRILNSGLHEPTFFV